MGISPGGHPPMQRIFAFVDGKYLRDDTAALCGFQFINPFRVAQQILSGHGVYGGRIIRVSYYDADPSDSTSEVDPKLAAYWKAVGRLADTHLRFGTVKGKEKKLPKRQKGVDVLLAVDMVVGALRGIFDAAILITGDADFVPAIQEVQRAGVVVVLGSFRKSVSDDLIDQADRFAPLDDMVEQLKTMELKLPQ